MIRRYKWTIKGTAALGQRWETEGLVEGDLGEAIEAARRASFMQLTKGDAVYGSPGVGCNGPYIVTSIALHLMADEEPTMRMQEAPKKKAARRIIDAPKKKAVRRSAMRTVKL